MTMTVSHKGILDYVPDENKAHLVFVPGLKKVMSMTQILYLSFMLENIGKIYNCREVVKFLEISLSTERKLRKFFEELGVFTYEKSGKGEWGVEFYQQVLEKFLKPEEDETQEKTEEKTELETPVQEQAPPSKYGNNWMCFEHTRPKRRCEMDFNSS